MSRWLRRLLFVLVPATLLIWVAAGALIYAFQRSFLYLPDIRDVTAEVASFPGAEAVVLTTPDGERLNAWWKPPEDGKPVYLYLHGNGGNLGIRARRFARMTDDGAGVLALSWRGYGGSTGSPSEDGLKADGETAYRWLTLRIPPERIVLWGESLGTGVAIWLAARHPARLLALDSPYASIADMAQIRFPLLPARQLVLDRFMSIDLAPQIDIPVAAQHCETDLIIPLDEARRLMAAFRAQPAFALVPGICHTPDPARGLLPLVRAALANS